LLVMVEKIHGLFYRQISGRRLSANSQDNRQ
jgi:hypothetical protein